MIWRGTDCGRCGVRCDGRRVVCAVAARGIFSLLELREYARVGGEQPFDRGDVERERVGRGNCGREVGQRERQAMFAPRRGEDDAAAPRVRRSDNADELESVAVERMTWVSNRDGLARRKSLLDRGSCVGGFCRRRRCP